jgi:hypothetical protein
MRRARFIAVALLAWISLGAKDCEWPEGVSAPPALKNEASGKVDDVSECEDDTAIPCIDQCSRDFTYDDPGRSCCEWACRCSYSCAKYIDPYLNIPHCYSMFYCKEAARICGRCFDAEPFQAVLDAARFGSIAKLKSRKGGDLDELPPDLRIREMPEVRRA